MDLLADLKKGKRSAIAKAISIIENDEIQARKII
ncbi:MAG: methylmalonyl Co-A mutase-associated GTPase MeaB, partial [Candidatus Nitrosotenuis sp.]